MHESEATRKPRQSARRLVRQAKNLPDQKPEFGPLVTPMMLLQVTLSCLQTIFLVVFTSLPAKIITICTLRGIHLLTHSFYVSPRFINPRNSFEIH
jgi:hypothetical protein